MLPKCAPSPRRTRLNIVGSVRSDRRELDLTDRELACIYCRYLFTFLRASRGFAASADGSLARHKVKGCKPHEITVYAELGAWDQSLAPHNPTEEFELVVVARARRGELISRGIGGTTLILYPATTRSSAKRLFGSMRWGPMWFSVASRRERLESPEHSVRWVTA